MRTPATVALCLVASACRPVMEATRPDPANIHQFAIGQKSINVPAEIGNPVATNPDGNTSSDIYKLYTRGPGAVGKGALAAGGAVAEVLTLGLSEVL